MMLGEPDPFDQAYRLALLMMAGADDADVMVDLSLEAVDSGLAREALIMLATVNWWLVRYAAGLRVVDPSVLLDELVAHLGIPGEDLDELHAQIVQFLVLSPTPEPEGGCR